MNTCQLIGQLYDPDCDVKIYWEGIKRKVPRVDFVLAVDRPYSGTRGVGNTFVRCNVGGDIASWFINNVKHGDVIAVNGFVDSRVVVFNGGKRKWDMRVVVTQINWIGKRKTQTMMRGTDKMVNLGDAGVNANTVNPKNHITVAEIPDEDNDDGHYDELPDWGGTFK